MTEFKGRLIFEPGDELFVRFPENRKETVRVIAVPATRDGDYCRDCIFNGICRKYPGNSPFGWHCYTTIFREVFGIK